MTRMNTNTEERQRRVSSRLDSVVLILVEPQSIDNVGATLRAMRTMGFSRVRLVRPAAFDWNRLPVIAHRTQDLITQMQVYEGLAEALADTTFVIGCTARRRALNLSTLTAHEAAQAVMSRAEANRVAVVFGREDVGLATSDLAHCHVLLTIPTVPDYASLNLAQAVMVVLYELRVAAIHLTPQPPSLAGKGGPDSPLLSGEGLGEGAATGAQTEAMFATLEEAMQAVGYLIPSRAEATLRAWRAMLLRAQPTAQEAALITALARAIATRR